MRNLRERIHAAIAAFRYAQHPPAYAVIYDVWSGGAPGCGDTREEFYELFGSPSEAAEMFRTAYPVGADRDAADNPRLVLILGGIDAYR